MQTQVSDVDDKIVTSTDKTAGARPESRPSDWKAIEIALVASDFGRLPGDVDTAVRDSSGGYARHIVETIRPPSQLDLSAFVSAA